MKLVLGAFCLHLNLAIPVICSCLPLNMNLNICHKLSTFNYEVYGCLLSWPKNGITFYLPSGTKEKKCFSR